MDTYFSIDSLVCTDCGKCIKACPDNLICRDECYDEELNETFVFYDLFDDYYVPCHHCDGFWEDNTPCQQVCEVDAIKLSRW